MITSRRGWFGIARWFGMALIACGGLDRKVAAAPTPNTSLQLPAEPGGFGYQMRRFLDPLTFPNAVALRTPHGETNRLFVLERPGRIAVVPDLGQPAREVFLDITTKVRLDNFNEMGLLGFTFHPQYAANGRFFVWYTTTTSTTGAPNQRHDRLSEFRVRSDAPNRADPASERILLQQADDAVNHNAGDLHFGPDGYLYLTLGDEGGGNDQYGNSQKITKDFFAGILRLDVDQRPDSLAPNPHPAVIPGAYRIPADNPFVGATQFLGKAVSPSQVHTEFWAVGLRNPWRVSFDELTGELWVGDVGQNLRETVTVTRRGANHGWAFREGTITGPLAGAPAGFLTNPEFNFVPPLFDYPHQSGNSGGFSITGGLVYRGSRLSQLFGAYIFADYVSGNVWALRRSPNGAAPTVTRLTGSASLAAFGSDPRNGDLLAANHESGQLFRLEYSSTFTGAPIPAKLSATGAFRDLNELVPETGLVPYDVNLPFWSDGAIKQRWFSLPRADATITFRPDGTWGTPGGTVWMKHFEIERTKGVPASRRRLETRFLVRNAAGVYGLTYRWNAAQSDAALVNEAGEDEDFSVTDADSSVRTQHWHYPSRSECLICHNSVAGGSLSFNTAQMNRSIALPDGGISLNQIHALQAAGYFGSDPINPHSWPVLAAPSDESVSLTWRAKSWLSVNCGYCHQPGGLGGAQFDARLETTLEAGQLIPGALNNSTDATRSLVRPGHPEFSELHARPSRRGAGQMPPLATSIPDPQGTSLLARWITEAAGRDTYAGWSALFFADTQAPGAGPTADPDQDGNFNDDEFRRGTSPLVADGPWGLRVDRISPQQLRLSIPQPANRALRFEVAEALQRDVVWQPVNDGAALPNFPVLAHEASLTLNADATTRFYRVRILVP